MVSDIFHRGNVVFSILNINCLLKCLSELRVVLIFLLPY